MNAHLDFWIIVETLDEVRSALPLLQERLAVLQEIAPDVEGQVKKGLAADIMRDIREGEYDLAILRFRGRRGLKKVFPRAEALSILHHARVNYLILWGRGRELGKFLFCTAGSPYGRQAVEFGARIAAPLGAQATVLYVAETEPALFLRRQRVPQEIEDSEARRALNGASETLEKLGIEAEAKVRYGKVSSQILAEASSGDYDIIVMGSHGMGGVRRFILGSVTEEVVKRSRIPVLVVRAQEERKLWRRFLGLK